MIGDQRRAGKEGFQTTGPATPASRSRNFVGRRPGQWIVPPLPSDRIGADDNLLSDGYPAPDPRPENDAEDRIHPCAGAIGCLGQCETIRVIGEPRRPGERGLDVVLQRPPDQPRRIGVLDETGGRRQRTRNPDPDRCCRADLLLDRSPITSMIVLISRAIIPDRGGDAAAHAHQARDVDSGSLDLGAAEIDADAKPVLTSRDIPRE